VTLIQVPMVWIYRLGGRAAWVDDDECEVSKIKWQMFVGDR
jgi:hypothetical protein